MQESFVPGRLVTATAGRDSGRLYLVLEKAPDNRVLVVDGDKHKIANPKRKNKKHLKPYPVIVEDINKKIKAGVKITDFDIRNALRDIGSPKAEILC